jgi:hypothetical protein
MDDEVFAPWNEGKWPSHEDIDAHYYFWYTLSSYSDQFRELVVDEPNVFTCQYLPTTE